MAIVPPIFSNRYDSLSTINIVFLLLSIITGVSITPSPCPQQNIQNLIAPSLVFHHFPHLPSPHHLMSYSPSSTPLPSRTTLTSAPHRAASLATHLLLPSSSPSTLPNSVPSRAPHSPNSMAPPTAPLPASTPTSTNTSTSTPPSETA